MIRADLEVILAEIDKVHLIEVEGGDPALAPVESPALPIWLDIKELIRDASAARREESVAAIALIVVKRLRDLASSKWVKGDLGWVLHMAELVEEEAKRIMQ